MNEETQSECKHENQVVINYNMMWHEGDVVCKDCGVFIRTFDAG